ncbi:hypothetical protein H5410_000417 [Solanum commersonii]|uniref:Uncharacterized protein n=1 Tax=Solanum commersonii TaxID=4109 RepID=A0A9J6AW72_SOLCO|nr:hypothetical protein H5410_000417 [Solanum commersonii]
MEIRNDMGVRVYVTLKKINTQFGVYPFTFIYSGEKKSSSIPRIQFDLVESGCYHEYPWRKDVFSKLVKNITKKWMSRNSTT